MKKILYILLVLNLALITSCNVSGSNNGDLETSTSSVSNLIPDDSLEKPNSKKVSVEFVGSFTACVRDLIPDYVLDDFTPQYAVVTQFQDTPFTVRLGEELAKQVEIDNTYVFEISSDIIVDLQEKDLEDINNTAVALNKYPIEIKSVRLANSDELGLGSGGNISYKVY